MYILLVGCGSKTSQRIGESKLSELGSQFIWSSSEADAIFKDLTSLELSISPIRTHFSKSAGGYYRCQLPLGPCHASTVHGCQGWTAKSPGGGVYEPPSGSPFAMALLD